jgi:hypothetical protein
VFDKFTGDGVISHFPIYEFDNNNGGAANKVVLNCAVCAWDMVRAATLYIKHLLPNLALRKQAFGPSVGIAFDNAQWSVDRVGNPIVVGKGVVHACRLGGGPAGTVQISNAVFSRIEHLLADRSGIEEVDFLSKEYKEGSGVSVVRMQVALPGLGTSEDELKDLVDGVFGDNYFQINGNRQHH